MRILQPQGQLLISFFFNDPATTGIYTLSLHDALPICSGHSIKLLRDGSGLFDFKKLESYSVLAEMLRREKLNSIVLFCEGVVWTPGAVQTMEERSEEHTSELQSHVNLVCRLLLEKKKI